MRQDIRGRGRERGKVNREEGWLVCWLLNVPAACECISGTDLLRQMLRAATLR